MALRLIRTGPPGDAELVLTDATGNRTVLAPRVPVADLGSRGSADLLPERVAELGDGVCYIDVARATAEDME